MRDEAKFLTGTYGDTLSTDYGRLYDIAAAGEWLLGYVTYKSHGEDYFLTDPVNIHGSIHDGVMTTISVGSRGMGFIDAWSDSKAYDDMKSEFIKECERLKLRFLDPTPKPLEPRSLEWGRCFDKVNLQATDIWTAKDGAYHYSAYPNGEWNVASMLGIVSHVAGGKSGDSSESAKAAIHEWRVNHINSMIGGNIK